MHCCCSLLLSWMARYGHHLTSRLHDTSEQQQQSLVMHYNAHT
jgi:hypothetical protein